MSSYRSTACLGLLLVPCILLTLQSATCDAQANPDSRPLQQQVPTAIESNQETVVSDNTNLQSTVDTNNAPVIPPGTDDLEQDQTAKTKNKRKLRGRKALEDSGKDSKKSKSHKSQIKAAENPNPPATDTTKANESPASGSSSSSKTDPSQTEGSAPAAKKTGRRRRGRRQRGKAKTEKNADEATVPKPAEQDASSDAGAKAQPAENKAKPPPDNPGIGQGQGQRPVEDGSEQVNAPAASFRDTPSVDAKASASRAVSTVGAQLRQDSQQLQRQTPGSAKVQQANEPLTKPKVSKVENLKAVTIAKEGSKQKPPVEVPLDTDDEQQQQQGDEQKPLLAPDY